MRNVLPQLALTFLAVAVAAGCGNGTPSTEEEFFRAVATNEVDRVRAAVRVHPKWLNAPMKNDWPALHWAATYGSRKTAEALLGLGANIGAKSCLDTTALHHAASNPETVGADQVTPLQLAASEGRARLVGLLIEHGADTGNKDRCGRTALYVAAEAGHADACRLLLAAGADPAAESSVGLTPLELARRRRHKDVIAVLEKAGGSSAP